MIDAHVHIFSRYRSIKAVRWLNRYIPWLEIDEQIDESEIVSRVQKGGASFFFNSIYPIEPDESERLNECNHELSGRRANAVCFGSVHAANENREQILRRMSMESFSTPS